MSTEIDKDWLRKSIEAKSDQLNADDLIAGPITVKITGVRRGKTPEQPIAVELDGNKEKPYLPCKGMRRLLIAAWTDDPKTWVGKRMTLYRNPEVMYGGVKLGGIEISSMSDIMPELQIMRTVRRGVKTPLTVKRLADEPAKSNPTPPAELTGDDAAYLADVEIEVETAKGVNDLTAIYKMVETKRPAILPQVKVLCGAKRKKLEAN